MFARVKKSGRYQQFPLASPTSAARVSFSPVVSSQTDFGSDRQSFL